MIRVLRAEDYDKLAQHIVNDFIESEVPLSDGVLKVAKEMALHPNHIENLVQLSNKLAHLRLFEKKSGDKIVEFETVKPRDVLQRFYADAPAEKVAEDLSRNRELDFFGDYEEPSEDEQEKTAEETVPELDPKREHPEKTSQLTLKIRKVAEELDSRRLQAEWEYVEELDKLAAEFAKLYGPNFEEFEKDAAAAFGTVAQPIMNDIRSRLRLEPKELSLEKTSRLADTDTAEMKSLEKLIKLAAEAADCARGRAYLQEQVGEVL